MQLTRTHSYVVLLVVSLATLGYLLTEQSVRWPLLLANVGVAVVAIVLWSTE